MSEDKFEKQKKAIQVKYNALISNDTWKLVDSPFDQYILTAK